jgi:uncharacterized protein YdcH (DUF465 family)
MDTITELKPLFMRFFQEVDALNAKIKGQEEEIKKLRAENEVYAKVIRCEVVEVQNTVVEPSNNIEEDSDEEEDNDHTQQQQTSHQSDTKHVEIKRGRKKKYTTDEERREKRKEYNRNYRQKQKVKKGE